MPWHNWQLKQQIVVRKHSSRNGWNECTPYSRGVSVEQYSYSCDHIDRPSECSKYEWLSINGSAFERFSLSLTIRIISSRVKRGGGECRSYIICFCFPSNRDIWVRRRHTTRMLLLLAALARSNSLFMTLTRQKRNESIASIHSHTCTYIQKKTHTHTSMYGTKGIYRVFQETLNTT